LGVPQEGVGTTEPITLIEHDGGVGLATGSAAPTTTTSEFVRWEAIGIMKTYSYRHHSKEETDTVFFFAELWTKDSCRPSELLLTKQVTAQQDFEKDIAGSQGQCHFFSFILSSALSSILMPGLSLDAGRAKNSK
jgi:hypothetical protein